MKLANLNRAVKLLSASLFGSTAQTRFEARHGLLTRVAYRCGMRIHNNHLIWYRDDKYLQIAKQYKDYKGEKIHERRYQLYQLAKSVKNLSGDTAECGVFRGEGSFLIMHATSVADRTHHIFDSFEGLSEPDSRDKVAQDRTFAWKKNDLSTPEAIVERNLKDYGIFKLHKGWIPDRFDDVKDKKFCFVNIDVDLYQPTFDSIAYFYQRMVPGGMIVCDDYGFESCPGAYKACHDFMSDKPEKIIPLITGQGLIIKDFGATND